MCFKMESQRFTISWTLLVMLFVTLVNLTGQLCQLVDSSSPMLKQLLSSSSSSDLASAPSSSLLSPVSISSSSSSSSDSNELSSDSTIIIDSSSFSSSPLTPSTSSSSEFISSSSDDNNNNNLQSTQLDHNGSKRKRYQPARNLVRPFWLNPKYTWKAFQMNSSRNEAKDAEMRKVRDKKRAKIRKLADKMKKAALISKKLYNLLDEISMNLDSDLV